MRLSAAASSSLRSALTGPSRPATWLGVTTSALYLQISSEPGALALLAHDAVRLPCALLLPTTAAERPLTVLVPARPQRECLVGDGKLAWTSAAGPVVVRAVREWRPASASPGAVVASALACVRAALPPPAALGVEAAWVSALTTRPAAAVAGLTGRGPGLTPAGDDVLAGFLVGALAFGVDAAAVRAATAALAPTRTSALSAALLRHAAAGECIDQVAAAAGYLTGRAGHSSDAVARLLAVGHTSGAALATGLVAAATTALRALPATGGVAAA